MRLLIEHFLKKINYPLDSFIKDNFKTYEIYSTPNDLVIGLLRYNDIPEDKAFIFNMPTERIQYFHTKNMKFSINIFFFDKDKYLVKKYINVIPGIEKISSIVSAKYVVECKYIEGKLIKC